MARFLILSRFVILCLLIPLCLLTAAQDGPQTGVDAPDPPSPLPVILDENLRFVVGVCTHFSQGKGIVSNNLALIQGAGIDAIRDENSWGAVEREKGVYAIPSPNDAFYRQAAQMGLHSMLVLDYANNHYDDGDRPRSPEAIEAFCRYAEFVVSHFGPNVSYYEVWNEWDIAIGMKEAYRQGGTPEDYFTLLKAVYPRIKKANPKAIVLGGCPTSGGIRKGWLEKLVGLGVLAYCDAISIHTYNYSEKFPEKSPEAWAAWMLEIEAMLKKANKGKDVPIYITEMGWPTHVGKANSTSLEVSASYAGRLFLLARTMPFLKGMWWYDFQDDGWNPEENEHNFGLVRPDLTPKPSFNVLRDIADLVGKGEFIQRLETDVPAVWILQFRQEGARVWVLWCGDDQERQIILKQPEPNALRLMNVQRLGSESYSLRWGYRPWVEERGSEMDATRLAQVIGPRPLVLFGNMDGITVEKIIPRFRQTSPGSNTAPPETDPNF